MAKKVETKSVKTIQEKWARLRQVAADDPKEADHALAEVAEALGTMADSLTNLRENLDLIEVPKSASIKARIANARKYANGFRRMAEEAPEVVADAISEVYHSLDDVAGALEHLAENMGITLDLTPAEEAFGEEGKEELAGEEPEHPFEEAGDDEPKEDEGEKSDNPFVDGESSEEESDEEKSDEPEEEVKEASGSDNWVTDRNEEGEPKSTILAASKECSQCGEGHGKPGTKCERHGKLIPKAKKKADGGAGFISDRDESAKPEPVEKVEIPQAEGDSEVNKAAKLREATRQRIAARHGITL